MNIEFLKPFGIQLSTQRQLSFTHFINGEELKELARKYQLVLLRGFVALEKNAMLEYAQTFGPLLAWEFGHVLEMCVREKPDNYLFTHGPVPFHWDGVFHQAPSFLLFNCIEAPASNCGGETLFTDTHRIWQESNRVEREVWKKIKITYQTEKIAHYGGCKTEPLVQRHPQTKKPILRFAEPVPRTMLNPVSLTIKDYPKSKSQQLIKMIAKRCYDKNNCYRHAWQKNDFLIADNHALLHARLAFTKFQPRHLRRIQVL